MENHGLYKIKSLYVLKDIFAYIRNENFPEKLFIHSKYFQKKLDLKFAYYKGKYLQKIGFDISEYLYIAQEKYKKDILTQNFNNFFVKKKFKKEEIKNMIFEVLDNEKPKYAQKLINIDSPLFEIVFKTRNFSNYYTIYISQKNIDENKMKDIYINFYDKLNKSNKFSSIFFRYKDKKAINYLKEFNVDFNKIKRLSLIQDSQGNEGDNDMFFNTFFSFNKIENNLIYLNICFNVLISVDTGLFKKINNFKSLRYLYLKNIKFSLLTIKLDNLIVLSLQNVKGLNISDIICNKLEKLDFTYSNNSELLNDINVEELKELKELNLNNNNIDGYDNGVLEILNCKKLEKLNLSFNKIKWINGEKSKKVFCKELKVLKLNYNSITDINGFFENVKYEKLQLLDLDNNAIEKIDSFEKANFKELKELIFSYNIITDISVLSKIKLEKLEKLNLAFNKISNMDILEKCNFKELKELYLNYNYNYPYNISDIKILSKFKKIEILRLDNNGISNINSLEILNFKELKVLDLGDNSISDIKVLEKANFE